MLVVLMLGVGVGACVGGVVDVVDVVVVGVGVVQHQHQQPQQ